MKNLSGFLADRTYGRAYATVFRPSVVCCLSMTLFIVSKWCVLEQKLLLTTYWKSYMRNWLVPKWMTLTFVQRSVNVVSKCSAQMASHLPLNISKTVRDRGLIPKDHP